MPITDLSTFGFQPGLPILVGVSGGPDSLALLHYLHSQGHSLLVASFNHQLRPGAQSDVEFVRDFSLQLGQPFTSGTADVGAHATSQRLSTEEAARELRYQFLFREARSVGAQAVAVGHTADDQAETVLMHFLRGAGLAGLKGMPMRLILPIFDRTIPLVRPLLTWNREETVQYCRDHGIQTRTDPTNNDTRYFRNRLRHDLLPLLETYNPNIRLTIARTAQALQGDYELLSELIEQGWKDVVQTSNPNYVEFDLEKLKKLSPGLAPHLLRRAAFEIRPGLRDMDFSALERALTFKPVDLAGNLKTLIEGNSFFVTDDVLALPNDTWPQLSHEIVLDVGIFPLDNHWSLSVEEFISGDLTSMAQQNSSQLSAWLDAGIANNHLRARSYKSGDRIEPLGMPRQTMKLADMLINNKIIRRYRTHWPVICLDETITWVPGIRLGEAGKVTENTKRAYKLTFIKA
jgi:tRNA(Ile)-lysidine synthase